MQGLLPNVPYSDNFREYFNINSLVCTKTVQYEKSDPSSAEKSIGKQNPQKPMALERPLSMSSKTSFATLLFSQIIQPTCTFMYSLLVSIFMLPTSGSTKGNGDNIFNCHLRKDHLSRSIISYTILQLTWFHQTKLPSQTFYLLHIPPPPTSTFKISVLPLLYTIPFF